MLPKISITIPSYNQADYLEETLRSVLEQHYSNLELIVIDGGSTDGSVEILKRYSNHLAYWVSERDRGQTHAITKGLRRSTGEIWSYLNSDDLLCPGSLEKVAESFRNPGVNWLGGVSEIFDETGLKGYVVPQRPLNRRDYLTPWQREIQYVFPCSNVCFMRRHLLEQCGDFDESYDYGMDIEYYVRVVFQTGIEPQLIPDILGRWRWHPQSKTLKQGIAYGFREDEVRMALQYLQCLDERDRQTVKREIQEQQKWLAVRKAGFYQNQGKPELAWRELTSQVGLSAALSGFRPWYGTARRLLLA
ncbi:glycosyltransferase [Leptolyngbya sp. DQ-M1]|uniref:glycosyltransferase family 2 protein n=1 Tax=Leptolyngbya sp. DQ-M1 TaxID=2933920 RepID=UPI0032998C2F